MNANLFNLKHPFVKCTASEYSNLIVKNVNTIYIITDSNAGSASIYFNNKIIATTPGGLYATNVNHKSSDIDKNIDLIANDIDAYNRYQIDDLVGNILNIQYISAPLSGSDAKSVTETFTKNAYPITDKNMVIEEDDTSIKFIVASSNGTDSNKISIRTMNKTTHTYTDVTTSCIYSTEANGVGYILLFADATYCYFSNTQYTTDQNYGNKFYRYNYLEENSVMESISNFPDVWSEASIIKAGLVVYLFGGTTHSILEPTYRNTIWKYDITNNTWSILNKYLPVEWGSPQTLLSRNGERIYLTMGHQSSDMTQWAKSIMVYFDINSENIVSLPNRIVDAISGVFYETDIGIVIIPLITRSGNNVSWGELGSQVYIETMSEYMNIISGLLLTPGSSTDGTDSAVQIKIIDIIGNDAHITVDTVSYKLTVSPIVVLGNFSAGESVYIKGKIRIDKDILDENDSIISANSIIGLGTKIKIIHDNTRVILLSDIANDGSWIMRPPQQLTGTVEETVLWEGDIGAEDEEFSTTINLMESILSFDMVGLIYTSTDGNGNITYHYQTFNQYALNEFFVTYAEDLYHMLWLCNPAIDDGSYLVIQHPSNSIDLSIRLYQSNLKKIIGMNNRIPNS